MAMATCCTRAKGLLPTAAQRSLDAIDAQRHQDRKKLAATGAKKPSTTLATSSATKSPFRRTAARTPTGVKATATKRKSTTDSAVGSPKRRRLSRGTDTTDAQLGRELASYTSRVTVAPSGTTPLESPPVPSSAVVVSISPTVSKSSSFKFTSCFPALFALLSDKSEDTPDPIKAIEMLAEWKICNSTSAIPAGVAIQKLLDSSNTMPPVYKQHKFSSTFCAPSSNDTSGMSSDGASGNDEITQAPVPKTPAAGQRSLHRSV